MPPRFVRFASAVLSCALGVAAPHTGVRTLTGEAVDPFAGSRNIDVLVFARTDCPLTKRYAPELRRIAEEFSSRPVAFWLVFPDATETPAEIASLTRDFHFPGTPLLDPKHALVKRAHASTAPEAAVFDRAGRLVYHGRVDDLYVDFGKSRPAPQVHDLEDAIAASLAGKAVRQAETHAVGCSLADVE